MSLLAEARTDGSGATTAGGPGRPDLRLLPQDSWPAALTENLRTGLSGFLGCEILDLAPGRVEARLVLRDELMLAAGDLLHAGTVVAFADSCAGWGCLATLPPGVAGFATGELKANLVATTRRPDALLASARLLHGGRSTQVWDVTVSRERDGRDLAYFRATQHLLAEER